MGTFFFLILSSFLFFFFFLTHLYCLVACLNMIVWTYAVLGVLYACVLYFHICTCSVQVSMFHMERHSRNMFTIIIVVESGIQEDKDQSVAPGCACQFEDIVPWHRWRLLKLSPQNQVFNPVAANLIQQKLGIGMARCRWRGGEGDKAGGGGGVGGWGWNTISECVFRPTTTFKTLMTFRVELKYYLWVRF